MFTQEQIKKAAACKSVEELLELAKAEGIQMDRASAEKIFAQLKEGEVSPEDLDKISGAFCEGNVCAQC